MPSSALVIGSSGFVGRHLVAALRDRGAMVQGVSRTIRGDETIPTCRPEEIDLLSKRYDCVYLLASVIPYGKLDRVTMELVHSNLSLPLQIVERFATTRFVYASSVAVYGIPLTMPIDESHPFHRPNAYGLSKALGERIVVTCESCIVLRFSSLYGQGMSAPTFLPRLIEQGRRERRLVIHGDGNRLQDYLHVDDAVQMLLAAGESQQAGIFNAVRGVSVANREAAQIVSDRLGAIPIEFAGADDSPSFVYSRTKWNEAFEFQPQVELAQGISRMLEVAE